MSTTTINARIDINTKAQVTEILSDLGLNTSQVISMLFKQIIFTRSIPFEMRLPNRETVNAFLDAQEGKNIKSFNSIEELQKELRS